MDIILQQQLEPMCSYLVDNLPFHTIIRCYESSSAFRSLAKQSLAKVSQSTWQNILSTCQVPVQLLEDFQDNLPWKIVVRHQNLSKETLERFNSYIDWSSTSVYLRTPFDILKHFVDQPDFSWSHFCKYVELPEEYLEQNVEKLDWEKTCYYQVLNEKFLREHIHKLHWKNVSVRQRLSENFIADHADHLDWWELSIHQPMSINFLKKFSHKIVWNSIVFTQTIPNDVLEDFKDQLNWNLLIRRQRFSESQFLKYEDKVDWHMVASSGDLSMVFIKENLHRLVWDDIIRCQSLTYEFIEDHIDYLDWKILSQNVRLPLLFIRNYLPNLDLFLLLINRSFPVVFIEGVLLKDPRFKNDKHSPKLWRAISYFDTLNEEFIHKYREQLHWQILCKYQTFGENFIADHHEYVYWSSICSRQKLSPSFLLSFKDHVCWPLVLVKQHVSQDFIKYITDNYTDMRTVLEYYENLKTFKKLHRIHCPKADKCHTNACAFLQIGDQLDDFNSGGNQWNDIFVWYLKKITTHKPEDLCSSFKSCIGCMSENCKIDFCSKYANFVEAYINYTYIKLVRPDLLFETTPKNPRK